MTAEIINLDEHRPHLTGKVQCLHCGHVWVAVIRAIEGKSPKATLQKVQCPNCRKEPFMSRELEPEEE